MTHFIYPRTLGHGKQKIGIAYTKMQNTFANFLFNISFSKEHFLQKTIPAVVLAQLAEWSLPIPEIRGSNPDTGKFV